MKRPISPHSKFPLLTGMCFSASLYLSLGHVARAEQYALLVAIEDYSKVSGAGNLPGCSNDLKGMKDFLTAKLGYPTGNVVSLIDGQATRYNILEGLKNLVAKAQPGDAVVFYYSGHGTQVPDMNDDDEADGLDEALVPSDFNPRDEATWLLDDHLRGTLAQLKTRRALVVIDACNSGSGTRSLTLSKKADFGFGKMLGNRADKSEIEIGPGAPATHVLISACAASEVSALGSYGGQQRSLFTTAFLNSAPGMLDSPLGKFHEELSAEMKRLDASVAASQHPQLESKIQGSLASIAGGTPARAEDAGPNNQPSIQLPSDGLPSAFKVMVSTNQREYRSGNEMVATVDSPKPGFLRLYYVDAEGNAFLIFPNFHTKENQIQGGQRTEVGAVGNFKFVVEPPGGTEMLLAAVSEDQFTDHDALVAQFKPNAPLPVGTLETVIKLVDRGAKQIRVVGTAPRPAQIGRAASFYDVVDPEQKEVAAIVKQIRIEGRAEFNEKALPFKLDSVDLADDAAQKQLVQIAAALQSPQLADAKFVIEGHTCDLGETDYNLDLSRRRAEAIKALLKISGVGEDRLGTAGLGESQPVDPGTSEESRAKNRRVEIKLVK